MSSGEKPLVQLIGIGKRYGTGPTAFDALHHVDLSINAGEFVAIMGPSGSGKSTTMNIIGALDTPTRGQYLFNGFHVEHFTRDQRALLRRQYLGFVFQGLICCPAPVRSKTLSFLCFTAENQPKYVMKWRWKLWIKSA